VKEGNFTINPRASIGRIRIKYGINVPGRFDRSLVLKTIFLIINTAYHRK
jgi:hypothetical protein